MMFSITSGFNLFFWIYFISWQGSTVASLKLTAKPSSSVVVGGRVVLHCFVGRSFERTLKTNWMHNAHMLGENCDKFSKKKSHSAVCSHESKTSEYYQYIIDPVEWSDRGKWSCYYGLNSSDVTLDVIVPPIIDKHTFKKNGKINGDGSRTKPFDLTRNQTIAMTCSSNCGYPKSEILWTFDNRSSNGRIGEPITVTSQCNETTKKGMYVFTSSLKTINCSRHHFVGLNKVSCSIDNREPIRYDSANNRSREVYILCPGGTEIPVLTYGEMIAIAVGAAIALILVFLNCFIFKERRRKAVLRNRALSV